MNCVSRSANPGTDVSESGATASTFGHVGQAKHTEEEQLPSVREPPRKLRVISAGKSASKKAETVVKEETLVSEEPDADWSSKNASSGLKSKYLNAKKARINAEVLTTDYLYFVPKFRDNSIFMSESEPRLPENGNVVGKTCDL